MEWQHHLDVINAKGLVEQFVNRGLTFQLDGMFPIHSTTLCALVARVPTTRALDCRDAMTIQGIGVFP